MWKSVLIGLAIIAVCHCQGEHNYHVHKKRPHYYDAYYHHLLYGGGILYYFAFIVIKIKVAIVLGTILTIFLVAGKFFALIKYADYMNKPKHEHTEKIYMPSHSHPHDDLGPTGYYSSPYASESNPSMTVDELPPNAVVASDQYNPSMMHAYGRSSTDKTNYKYLRNYYDLFLAMIRKANLTDTIFEKINLKSIECKKKIICKIEYNFKYFASISQYLPILRDDQYDTYRPNTTIKSWADCDRLHRQCHNVL